MAANLAVLSTAKPNGPLAGTKEFLGHRQWGIHKCLYELIGDKMSEMGGIRGKPVSESAHMNTTFGVQDGCHRVHASS